MIDVASNVARYLGERSPVERASSFDYCFNYFQSFNDRNAAAELAAAGHLEASCLHLGYYLASWGMLSGSTTLHTKSYRYFEPAVEAIAAEPATTWHIDADAYTEEHIDALLATRDRVAAALSPKPKTGGQARMATNTLVTKVMLSVFGSVPAFDTFFVRGLRAETGRGLSFGRKALAAVGDFHQRHRVAVDAVTVSTLDAATGQQTEGATRRPRSSTWPFSSKAAVGEKDHHQESRCSAYLTSIWTSSCTKSSTGQTPPCDRTRLNIRCGPSTRP